MLFASLGAGLRQTPWFHFSLRPGRALSSTGSVIENPHGLHLSTFRFSANARRIVWSNIIECPQTGQATSVGAASVIKTIFRALVGRALIQVK
jgi:hypothetical protein